MESYERSNCASCHSKAGYDRDDPGKAADPAFDANFAATDMAYWLRLEVYNAEQPPGTDGTDASD